jgi:DNA-binding transcriptional MerR regulator
VAKRPLDYNWAKDKQFAQTIGMNLISIHRDLEAQRQERHEVWQQSYRAWSVDRTGADRNYTGMANLQIPQLRKEIETMSRRIYKGMLPDDYLKAEPVSLQYAELAEVNMQLVRHYFDNVIKFKTVAMPWIKQGVTFGTSPMRSYWHKNQNEMMFKKREPKIMPDGRIEFNSREVSEMVTLYDGPKLRSEDIFNTYVYPHNASRSEDIEMVFWLTKVRKHELDIKAKKGMCEGFDEFKDTEKTRDVSDSESEERLLQFGDSGLFLSLEGTGYFDLMEIWCPLLLPGNDVPVSCVVEIINGSYVTRIQRNPYWHQQIPYDFFRFITPLPGEFYGRGLPEAAASLQHQLDDTMNQTMDSNTLRLNNITIINPAYAPNSDSFEIEPNAVWWADPNAVKQLEFPDLSTSGFAAAGALRQMISELSDNQPQLPDPIAGKARSTGQAQMAINEWQTDLFTFIDFASEDALNSLAYKVHLLIQQNIKDDEVIKITGRYANTYLDRYVTAEEIVGQYRFKWIGALQIENVAIRTQQILNFLKLYPTLPPDAQAKISLQWENLIIKILRDGFNIKDIENVIETNRMKASVSAPLEEKIMKLGGKMIVHESDNDEAHISGHRAADLVDKDFYTKAQRAKHIFEHEEAMKNKMLAAQMAQQQMMMAAPEQAAGTPGMMPQGAPMSDAINPGDMARGMRVENGI